MSTEHVPDDDRLAAHDEPVATDGDLSPDDREALAAHLRDVIPGAGPILDERVATVLALYDHLRDHAGEPVATVDLKPIVADRASNHPDVHGYADVDRFWSTVIKATGDRPNALATLPGVEAVTGGSPGYLFCPAS